MSKLFLTSFNENSTKNLIIKKYNIEVKKLNAINTSPVAGHASLCIDAFTGVEELLNTSRFAAICAIVAIDDTRHWVFKTILEIEKKRNTIIIIKQ